MNGKSFMLMLSIAWLLAGCGAAGDSTIEEAAIEQTEAAAASGNGQQLLEDVQAAVVSDVPSALASMNDIVKALKQTVEQDSSGTVPISEVTAQADELAALWKAVAADVRSAHEAHAADLEAGIIELAQAVREEPADRDKVIEADYRIYQLLRDVSALFH